MKFSKYIITIGLVLSVVIDIVQPSTIYAQDATVSEEQAKQIKASCVSTKATLSRLHSSDALMRVNAGQIYESISTKLMDGFNARVSNNSMNNAGLIFVSNDYEAQLDTFRNDYITYEGQLSKAINTDCANQPADFYNAILDARTKRGDVYGDVVKLNQYIDSYSSAVNKFEKEYLAAINEV